MIPALFQLLHLIFTIYLWSLLALIIASWLIAFKVLNPYQPAVRMILRLLNRVHEPILRPIRDWQYRVIPNLGGVDLSPIVAILVAQYLVLPLAQRLILLIFG
ncbi:MAG: YggT family protein [Alphaproteobacteria bacterium]|nr:YggT family protein [Alphaproteobacteria bacterium]